MLHAKYKLLYCTEKKNDSSFRKYDKYTRIRIHVLGNMMNIYKKNKKPGYKGRNFNVFFCGVVT